MSRGHAEGECSYITGVDNEDHVNNTYLHDDECFLINPPTYAEVIASVHTTKVSDRDEHEIHNIKSWGEKVVIVDLDDDGVDAWRGNQRPSCYTRDEEKEKHIAGSYTDNGMFNQIHNIKSYLYRHH